MKALTLHNPWPTFMAAGMKTIETRSWGTAYRGPLAIHAAKMTREQREFCMSPEYLSRLREIGYRSAFDVPDGAIVAIGELVSCERMTREMYEITAAIDKDNFNLGLWLIGRYAWRFRLTRCLLDDPISARGHQGLWDWEPAS